MTNLDRLTNRIYWSRTSVYGSIQLRRTESGLQCFLIEVDGHSSIVALPPPCVEQLRGALGEEEGGAL